MGKFKNFRSYVAHRWMRPFRCFYGFVKRRISRKQRLMSLLSLSNLKPDAVIAMSQDERSLMDTFAKLIVPSHLVTRKGRIIHAIPELEDVELWQMIEARRAETAIDRIKGWCGYVPETVADMIKLSKFIEAEFHRADQLEAALLPRGGGKADTSPIAEAKNILGMVQMTAELMSCSFEEAKKINYSDAILAISRRHDEVERMKTKTKTK